MIFVKRAICEETWQIADESSWKVSATPVHGTIFEEVYWPARIVRNIVVNAISRDISTKIRHEW